MNTLYQATFGHIFAGVYLVLGVFQRPGLYATCDKYRCTCFYKIIFKEHVHAIIYIPMPYVTMNTIIISRIMKNIETTMTIDCLKDSFAAFVSFEASLAT